MTTTLRTDLMIVSKIVVGFMLGFTCSTKSFNVRLVSLFEGPYAAFQSVLGLNSKVPSVSVTSHEFRKYKLTSKNFVWHTNSNYVNYALQNL